MLSCMSTPHSQELEWRTKFHKPPIDKELQPTLRPKHKALTNGHRIARHLPVPFINGAGEATVPKLTEFVLSRFEDDRLTFSSFARALTHSRCTSAIWRNNAKRKRLRRVHSLTIRSNASVSGHAMNTIPVSRMRSGSGSEKMR